MLVVGEGAAPSRPADLAFTGAYNTPLHGRFGVALVTEKLLAIARYWCKPTYLGII